MRPLFLACLFALSPHLLTVLCSAQEGTLPRPPEFASVEVREDRSITFRIWAPLTKSVRLLSSDLPSSAPFNAGIELTQAKNGVWETTIAKVDAGSYRYHFELDGVAVMDPKNPTTSESNGSTWSLMHVSGSEVSDIKEVPHGAIAEWQYFSKSLSRFRRVHVYTPPGYERESESLPVLYLLHGASDSDASWSTVGRAGLVLDNLIAANKAKPMIVVMPMGHTGPFSFGPGGGNFQQQMAEFQQDFVNDLRPQVEQRYRISSERKHRAIAGLSMGGAQALDIAISHLNDYGFIGVFSSGVFGINAPQNAGNTSGTPWEEKHAETLDNADLRKGLQLIWFATGKEDFLLSTTQETVRVLSSHGFDVQYQETSGGHTWIQWREHYLPEFVQLLFRDDGVGSEDKPSPSPESASSLEEAMVRPAAESIHPIELVTFTTQEDHRNMMEQLGIKKLRPGPSGNEQEPNHANYEESKANPYPNLPELLTLNDGTRVVSSQDWWQKRRPEIVEEFEREVVGRVPTNVPAVSWKVAETRDSQIGEVDVVEKHLIGQVDNSACPAIEVKISMSLTLPKNTQQPIPVLIMFGPTPFDPPPVFGFPGGRLRQSPNAGRPSSSSRPPSPPGTPGGFRPAGPSSQQLLLEAGWGYAMLNPGSVQADNGAGLTRGIIGLTNLGQPRNPDDWGALRAWAWGAAQGFDYLKTEPLVDSARIGIEGVSRYGKAALVTMAFDTRFAAALVGSSGEGGAKLHRRNFGEAVENLTGSGEYHWMAGNFLKYGTAESSFGEKTANDIPVDAHQLVALCAPRLTFISYGIPERGDAKWLDQQGSYMAAIAAGPVFELLGAKALGRSHDYQTEKMPDVGIGLLDGDLAWRQHDGGHTDGPNIPYFIEWANRRFQEKSAVP